MNQKVLSKEILMKRVPVQVTFILLLVAVPLVAGEPVDLVTVSEIRAEGLDNSEVMDLMWHLTDLHGPRLTGSPGLKSASEWSRDKMASWGMKNAQLEKWGEFGSGWSLEKLSIDMVEPYYSPIIAYPKAWTAGTEGRISGTPMLVKIESESDFDEYRGKLAGAIVMIPLTRQAETHFEADATRFSEEQLEDLAEAPTQSGGRFSARRAEFRRLRALRNKIGKFLKDESVAVVLEGGRRGEHGTLFVSSGGGRGKDEIGVPSAVVAVEHFARVQRFLEKDVAVKLELEIQTEVHSEDLSGYNVVADIPGSDPALKDEIVMLGGHLDSWHAATGAADNAAGCAVAMEAARIIMSLDVPPRRTIRVALWSGEEQGLLGSRAYVAEHFGNRETMELKPAHSKLAGYFNLDNGTGRIRGVYLQGNAAVRPIFEAYLKPFNDLGASTLTIRNTGGTDHLAFDAVGLPGFQFIQDEIDYDTRTHHTNMDFYDHAIESDLKQAAVIMASFVYQTAMRDEKLPRKQLPEPQKRRDVTP